MISKQSVMNACASGAGAADCGHRTARVSERPYASSYVVIFRICAALAVVFLLASVCLAADKPVSDDLIVDQVRIKLSADAEVKGGALQVECKQGVVTLAGSVETSRQKDKAARLAKKIKGVKQVINNIEIKKHG